MTSHVPDLRDPTLRSLPSTLSFSIIRNMEALVLLNILNNCLMLIRLSLLIWFNTKSCMLSIDSSLFRIVPLLVSSVPLLMTTKNLFVIFFYDTIYDMRQFTMTFIPFSMTPNICVVISALKIKVVSLTLQHPVESHAISQAYPRLNDMWLHP